jgi:CRISPR/Cas system-associated exonuclease Cas4 (RecB family)
MTQSKIENLKSAIPNPFTFSQSSLQDYVDCQRRFQLRYIEQLQWPAVETAPMLENERRQLEGQQFHRLAQQNLIGLPAEKLARLANSENLARWWSHWIDFRSLLDFGSLSPELTLSAPIGQHRLMAKYDLVTIKDDRAIIYDWKTYHKRPKDEHIARRMQTKVYRALLVVAGAHLNGGQPFAPEQVEMVYWYTDFPTEPARFVHNSQIQKRDWGELISLVSEISAKQSFPLTDDEKKCSFCSYRSYCERGVSAGESKENESELTAAEINLEQIQEIEF